MKNLIKGTAQVLFFVAFSFLMNKISSFLPVPIPGSILGIVTLFLLLQLKVIRLDWIDLGAKWLLAELLLFFIPSAVGIMQYTNVLISDGPRLTLVMILSTVIVMTCAGLVAEAIGRRRGNAS